MYQLSDTTLHGLLHTANTMHRLLGQQPQNLATIADAQAKALQIAAELANLIPVPQSSAPPAGEAFFGATPMRILDEVSYELILNTLDEIVAACRPGYTAADRLARIRSLAESAQEAIASARKLSTLQMPSPFPPPPHQLSDVDELAYSHDPELITMHRTLNACEHELASYQLIYHLTGTLSQAIARHRDLHANAGLIVDLLTAEKRRLTTELNAAAAP